MALREDCPSRTAAEASSVSGGGGRRAPPAAPDRTMDEGTSRASHQTDRRLPDPDVRSFRLRLVSIQCR